jgi:uncharacterized membrane protein YfcA
MNNHRLLCRYCHRRRFFIKKHIIHTFAGTAAGVVNGIFGAGGGMVLLPLLRAGKILPEEALFPSSVAIILPICIVTLLCNGITGLPWKAALPYLLGGAVGGILAATCGKRIPTLWLHRILGIMIIYGGIRYLC